VALLVEDLACAQQSALAALEILDPLHDPWQYGRGLMTLAILAESEARFADAESLLSQIEALGPVAFRFAPYEPVRTRAIFAIGAGDLPGARALLAAPPPATPNPMLRAEDQQAALLLLILEERWPEAAETLRWHTEVYRNVGYLWGEVVGYVLSALVSTMLEDAAGALRWSDAAHGTLAPALGPVRHSMLLVLDAIALLPDALARDPGASRRLQGKLAEVLARAPSGPTTGLPCLNLSARIAVRAMSRVLERAA
jgi:hypothetical protein